MPSHVHYVEPFFGGGSVLFAKPYEGVSEVINDRNDELANFWLVLSDPDLFADFHRRVSVLGMSETLWKTAWEGSPVKRAVAFFVKYRQSRQGLGKDFATLSRNRTRRGMNEQASSWLSAVEGLPEVHSRLQRVVVLNRDALNVIHQQDGEQTLFYLDPPYLHETRVTTNEYGEHEMVREDHEKLLELLLQVRGKFLLSGYPSELYAQFATEGNWRRVDFEIDNKASSRARKPRVTECVWLNY
jgi:DNA adenine methylase